MTTGVLQAMIKKQKDNERAMKTDLKSSTTKVAP